MCHLSGGSCQRRTCFNMDSENIRSILNESGGNVEEDCPKNAIKRQIRKAWNIASTKANAMLKLQN